MLMRTINGNIIEINRETFSSDNEYYKEIIRIKFNVRYDNKGSMLDIKNYVENKI
tara:strand:- start:273 stop:437 length:165 start_codon:yes stop_codon:yes gene_type:complete